jgi:acyl carrier protein
MQDHRDKLTEIFRDLFDNDDLVLRDDTTAGEVAGWDSLKNIKLMIRIEKAFRIRFGTGEVVGLKNVGELLALIDKKTVSS